MRTVAYRKLPVLFAKCDLSEMCKLDMRAKKFVNGFGYNLHDILTTRFRILNYQQNSLLFLFFLNRHLENTNNLLKVTCFFFKVCLFSLQQIDLRFSQLVLFSLFEVLSHFVFYMKRYYQHDYCSLLQKLIGEYHAPRIDDPLLGHNHKIVKNKSY